MATVHIACLCAAWCRLCDEYRPMLQALAAEFTQGLESVTKGVSHAYAVARDRCIRLNDEEQLAGVLGHEIGHVTARHSAQQYTQATTAGVGLTLLSIFVPEA